MEQTPSFTACRDVNPLKRPGINRLWSWQAVAHGADAVLYFQLRASRGASEKYHGAVIGHAGRADTRVFGEVAQLGAELDRLGGVSLGARTPARVALLFDWDSWWALEISDGPSRLVRYQQVVLAYHRALWDAGADVDVVAVTADLSGYDVVVAPALHMVKGDLAQRLEMVAARGGSVVTTFLSGRVDEDDNVFELVIPQGAEIVGTYRADFYAGTPAVTRNTFGAGHGWYVAAGLEQDGVSWVMRQVLARHDLLGPYADVPDLEAAVRVAPDGTRLLFLLNHATAPAEVAACATGLDLLTGERVSRGQPLVLDPAGVMVIRCDDTL